MVKSNTNKIFDTAIETIVSEVNQNSILQLKELEQDYRYRVEKVAKNFLKLFIKSSIGTFGPASLGEYSVHYDPLSRKYAKRKQERYGNRGFFHKTGRLKSDLQSLASIPQHIFGETTSHSYYVHGGARRGYSERDSGTRKFVRSRRTGRFVRKSRAFENFKFYISITPFMNLVGGFGYKDVERNFLSKSYFSIYSKLVNNPSEGGGRFPYRPALYAFTRWWFRVHLPRELRHVNYG